MVGNWSDSNEEEKEGEEDMDVIEEEVSIVKKKGKTIKEKRPSKHTPDISVVEDSDDDLEVVQELTKEEKEKMKEVETLGLYKLFYSIFLHA